MTLLLATLLGLGFLVVPSMASADPGDVGVEGPSHDPTGTPTGTKRAESVLWFNDGIWWGNLWDTVSDDFHIFRFNPSTQAWVDTGVRTETRVDTHHDVLWDGTILYIASHKFVNDGLPAQSGYPSTLRRYTYSASNDTYSLNSTTQINNHRTETLVIDKDTTGRLWATWQQDNKIYLNVTGTDGKTWGTPFAAPGGDVGIDDTSALIAFGPGKMGLMWSRQLGDSADGFYWSVHTDGAPVGSWSTPRGIVTGQRSGDDHMNLKWLDASGGRVFAAVKTEYSSASQPLLQLLAMDGSGAWSVHDIATVSECPNRVIVLIDEGAQLLRTFATYPKPSGTLNAGVCTSSGGAIYEKSTPINAINFTDAKTARIVDADQYVHNVTSTKQNLNNGRTGGTGTAKSGVLVLADVNATKRYWHHYEAPSGDSTAPTVTEVSPADGATDQVVGTDVTGTFSEAMDPATVSTSTFTLTPQGGTTAVGAAVGLDGTGKVATLNPDADLAAGTTYTATIKGGASGVKDAAGNALAADRTWTFTTAAASGGGGGGTEETVTLTATADSYVSSGSGGSNYGTASALGVDGSPVEISYLKFDLSAHAGKTLTDAKLQVRATNGSSGTQNVKLVADDSWTEGGITYNNRPALGAAVGQVGPTTTGTNYTIALSASGLQNDLGQPLSLGMDATSSDGMDMASRETATKPTLVLTLSGSGDGTGEPVDSTAPTVTEVSPADGAADVAVGSNVTATFSEAMDAATITSSTFTLTPEGSTTPVTATVTYDGASNTATLDPGSDLAAGTKYIAKVTTGAKDTAGNALAAEKTWSFTSAAASGGGGTSETVTLTVSEDSYVSSGSTGSNYGTATVLGVDASPTEISYLKFDLSAHAGKTVTGATLQVRATSSGSSGKQNVKLVGDDSWTETGITYTNKPALGAAVGTLGPTSSNTNYTVTLDAAALQNELGQMLSLGLDSGSSDGLDLGSGETATPPQLVLTLSGDGSGGGGGGDTTAPTVSSVSPTDGAADVAVGSNVTATFSEAMDPATVSSSTFTLTPQGGTTAVGAAVGLDGTGKVATLNPTDDLAAGTTYTATIKGGASGVKDAAGNALAADRTWTFTTAAASGGGGGGTEETVTLTATEDSHVVSGSTANFGTSTTLEVDGSPATISYLKFDLSAYAGRTITGATLQLRCTTSGSTGQQAIKLVADDSWTEGGITYANRPEVGSSLGTLGPTSKSVSYDVTLNAAALQGELGQALSLGIDSTSGDGVDLASSEATTGKPTLVLTFAP